MSYENGTLHYSLPQTVGSDKRDWFDTNEPFARIDADLWTAKETAEGNAEALTIIRQQVSALQEHDTIVDSTIVGLADRISANEQAISKIVTELADVRQDYKDSICAYDEGTATVSSRDYAVGAFFWYNDTLYKVTVAMTAGDTIVPNTNCEATTITEQLMS